MRQALHEIVKCLTALAGTATSTQTSAALDTTGFKEALITLSVGAVSGTSPTLDVKVQSSATSGGTYADITGAVFGQKTSGGSITAPNVFVSRLQLDGQRPFLKVVATIAGTTPSFALAVDVKLAEAINEPVTQANTVAFNLDPT